MDLTLEVKEQDNATPVVTVGGPSLMLTPPIDEDYWLFRVRLSETQAIVGFPKFITIGIGFASETDWNTNLPYTCGTEEIYDHIAHNKGDEAERLLSGSQDVMSVAPVDGLTRGECTELAQVHAMLALAAATALGSIRLDEDGFKDTADLDWRSAFRVRGGAE